MVDELLQRPISYVLNYLSILESELRNYNASSRRSHEVHIRTSVDGQYHERLLRRRVSKDDGWVPKIAALTKQPWKQILHLIKSGIEIQEPFNVGTIARLNR